LLVEHVFDLTHALRLLNSILLALLVPAPFVHLGLSQASLDSNHEEGLFGPVGIVFKLLHQGVELLACLALPLANVARLLLGVLITLHDRVGVRHAVTTAL